MLVIVSGSWEHAGGDTYFFGLLLDETRVWLAQKQTTHMCYRRLHPPSAQLDIDLASSHRRC